MNFVQDVDVWLRDISPEKENSMAKAGAAKKAQPNLPGELESQGIPEIDAAAGDLITANSERGSASKKVKDAGERLIKVMKKHGKEHYKVGGIEVWIDHGTEKAKAKVVGGEED